MAARLLGLGLLLAGGRAAAQDMPPTPPPAHDAAAPDVLAPVPATDNLLPLAPVPGGTRREKTLHFSREPFAPVTTAPVPSPAVPSKTPAGAAGPDLMPEHPVAVSQQQLPPPRALDGFGPRPPRPSRKEGAEEGLQYTVPTEVPGPQRLFGSLQSDAQLVERIRQERRSQSVVERVTFPEEVELSKTAYAGRMWAPLKEEVQPGYLIYRRLLFEQKNTERYGWDLGVVQPALSTLHFFADVALLPYHAGTRPFQQYDSDAGYCLPGDPVPLMLYPPEFSWTGLAAEAAVIGIVHVAFP